MEKGVAPDFNKLGKGPPIHRKFEANLCGGLREVENGILHITFLVTYLGLHSLALPVLAHSSI